MESTSNQNTSAFQATMPRASLINTAPEYQSYLGQPLLTYGHSLYTIGSVGFQPISLNPGYYTMAAAASYRDVAGAAQIGGWLPLPPITTSMEQNNSTQEQRTEVVKVGEKIAAAESVENQTQRDKRTEEAESVHTEEKYEPSEDSEIGYPCGQCDKKFLTMRTLVRHLWFQRRAFTCNYCDKQFRQRRSYMSHNKFNVFTCPLCLKAWNSHEECLEHMRNTLIHVRCQCDNCIYTWCKRKVSFSASRKRKVAPIYTKFVLRIISFVSM